MSGVEQLVAMGGNALLATRVQFWRGQQAVKLAACDIELEIIEIIDSFGEWFDGPAVPRRRLADA